MTPERLAELESLCDAASDEDDYARIGQMTPELIAEIRRLQESVRLLDDSLTLAQELTAQRCAEIALEESDGCRNAGITGPWNAACIRDWGAATCNDIARRIRREFGLQEEKSILAPESNAC